MRPLQIGYLAVAAAILYPFLRSEPSVRPVENAAREIPVLQPAKLEENRPSFQDRWLQDLPPQGNIASPSHADLVAPPPDDDAPRQTDSIAPSQTDNAALSQADLAAPPQADMPAPAEQQQKVEEASLSPVGNPPDAAPAKQDFSYLADYAYSEVPPDEKPADTVLNSLKDVPVGTPIEEIKRASEAFGLDFTFMKTVAKIESDFDPKERTGSYIGLFQLSRYEFKEYGSGEITNPRDNAIAAAYKFATAAILFELATHKKATPYDLYLIHQQGTEGAAEHVGHPDRIAWQSMCATDEGKEKGESWCKKAIWRNTLPAVKQVWKSVDKLTSGAFVEMWHERLDHFYARYSAALAPDNASQK